MKSSCAVTIRGLWDELNQGIFPWIDDNIGELDAKHRLFMAVCEAVIRPREFDYARWKGNRRPPASRLKIFKAFLLKAVLNVKDTKELVRMLRAEPRQVTSKTQRSEVLKLPHNDKTGDTNDVENLRQYHTPA